MLTAAPDGFSEVIGVRRQGVDSGAGQFQKGH